MVGAYEAFETEAAKLDWPEDRAGSQLSGIKLARPESYSG